MNEVQPEETQPGGEAGQEAKTWGMVIHLSLLAGYLIPMAGLIAPIVIYVVKKDTLPEIQPHAYAVFNWIISALIYGIAGLILLVVGIGVLVLIAVAVLSLVFPIIGAIKASDGDVWPYPLSIKVFK